VTPTTSIYTLSLHDALPILLTAGLSSTNRFIEYHEGVMACLPKGVLHQLPLLGVHPKHQSKGYGRALMLAVERLCRENPRSCGRSEEHTSELQSRENLVCRL